MTRPSGRVHLVGIGGMHMSAIAQLLLADGIEVSGSDLVLSPLTDRLSTLGARIHSGHNAANVGAASLVVTTAAARYDNPELTEARRRGIPVLPRHEMVARLLERRIAVAVAGTHGKTTTSSLIAVLLERAGFAPTYLLGGESLDLGGNAAPGTGRHVVVEADEYAGAFLAYHPQVAIVTNVEVDHLDYYGSEDNLLQAFRGFLDNVSADGIIIACADSPLLRQILGPSQQAPAARIEWYSLERDANWRALDINLAAGEGARFSIARGSRSFGEFSLTVPGRHNVSNALAGFAAGTALGLTADLMRPALAGFRGAHRRFELVGEARNVTVVDDYAHHPTEVRATLAAARFRYPGRRLVVLFQPHTYSRTEYLLDGFRNCFDEADQLYLLQTFAARETPDAGMDAFDLAQRIDDPRPRFLENLDDAVAVLAHDLRPGDVCFTMGAGNVTSVGAPLLRELNRG